MICPHCGVDVDNGRPTTTDGTAHAYCANVAAGRAARPGLTYCYKHKDITLDEAGWCATCRAWVDRAH